MQIDDAANFLVGTLLIGLAFCLMGVLVLFLNNIFSKYWKPVHWRIENLFSDYSTILPAKKEKKTEKSDKPEDK